MVKRYKKELDCSYTLGITLTIELLKKKPELVKNVYIHSSFDKKTGFDEIKKLCDKNNVLITFSDKPFNILSQKDNCYVIGEFSKYVNKIDLFANHLVLVNPSDAGNLGTIIRSALGFDFPNIVIISPAVDYFNPKVIRASMGAVFHTNIVYFSSFEEYSSLLKDHTIYPFMLQTDNLLSEEMVNSTKTKYVSLVFGNEATGLNSSFLTVGKPIKINHSNKIDSLNLPVAVSIGLFAFSRRK